ncbi:helix-turn-helix protein [Dysgonomonas alginatilytica]|uniref:Helix-turn-helix protein n=1 Tax=Dysgonomonas alginatilytica TaxID=1605892 RepID=A0A2V3PRN4_9BACT|nr:helix-turn-helix transcriptional regulator [Dysgonomonas alginatilytica]PXV66856.1 helix-turn-helix protein [Dysgonomonas alginatilytica]
MKKNMTTDLAVKELHTILRERREELGMTQKQLAEKIGVREATISDFETGKSTVNSNIIKNILGVLLVSISKTPSELEQTNKALWDESINTAKVLADKGYDKKTVEKMSYEEMCSITGLPFVNNLDTIITNEYYDNYIERIGTATVDISLKFSYFKTVVLFNLVSYLVKK